MSDARHRYRGITDTAKPHEGTAFCLRRCRLRLEEAAPSCLFHRVEHFVPWHGTFYSIGWNNLFHRVKNMIPLLAIFNQDASSLPKNNYQSGETTTFLTPFSGEKRHSLSPLPLRCYSQSPDSQIVLQGGNGDKGFKNFV